MAYITHSVKTPITNYWYSRELMRELAFSLKLLKLISEEAYSNLSLIFRDSK